MRFVDPRLSGRSPPDIAAITTVPAGPFASSSLLLNRRADDSSRRAARRHAEHQRSIELSSTVALDAVRIRRSPTASSVDRTAAAGGLHNSQRAYVFSLVFWRVSSIPTHFWKAYDVPYPKPMFSIFSI